MSHPKSEDEEFTSSWNQATAWAQQNNIKLNTLAPVYQYDLGRLQAGEDPMSQAERVRAIKAANNPNDVTPVPADHPDPASFFGNAVSDLRNIFTGLAPNHLVPNMFRMGESAILHPSTWLDPIGDVTKGILSGNLNDIRKGFDLASQPGDILGTMLPGVSDINELLKGTGGIDELLSHPISSLIDIAPFAPVGKVLSLAANDSRLATMADNLGMSVEQLRNASLPKLGQAWLLARDFTKDVDGQGNLAARFPGSGALTKMLTDEDGNPLTLGGALRLWGQAHTGLGRTFSHVFSAAFDLRTYGTDAEQFVMAPLAKAETDLTEDQKKAVNGLVDKSDPRAQGKTDAEIMADDSIDPKIRDAYEKMRAVLDTDESRAAAAGGLVSVEGPGKKLPNGKFQPTSEVFSVLPQPHPVVEASREARDALDKAMQRLAPDHALTKEVRALDKAGDKLVASLEDSRQKAAKDLVEGRLSEPVRTNKKGEVKASVHLDLSKQQQLITGDEGLIAKLADALSTRDSAGRPKQRDFQTAVWLAGHAKKALDHDGYGAVDADRSPALMDLRQKVDLLSQYAKRRVARERTFLDDLKRTGPSRVQGAVKEAVAAQRRFEKAWWDNPPDRFRPLLYDKMIDQILHRARMTDRIGNLDDRLRDPKKSDDWNTKQIARVHSDPRVLAQAIWQESKAATTNVGGAQLLSEAERDEIYHTAVDEVNKLREQGHEVGYVPVVTSLDINERNPGRYGVGVAKRAVIKDLSMSKRRIMDDFMPERYDLMASVHTATKEALERDVTIEFVDTHLGPHAMTSDEVYEWAKRSFPDELYGFDPKARNLPDVLNEVMARRMGLVKWDPMSKVGFTFPKWQETGMYLPKGLADSVDKLLDPKYGRFPLDGFVDKTTGAFRFSVLGLSPRYTAHIVFGGTFLLVLRSSPRMPLMIMDALRMVKGDLDPMEIRQRATEFGSEPVKYRDMGFQAASQAGGHQLGNMLVQQEIKAGGGRWQDSTAVQWAKAAGNANYKFTNYVSRVQRALAYLDGHDKALRSGKKWTDPETGVDMTAERAKYEGIQHALHVMGNLKAMTPFERSVMTRVIPFYGWTRHILQYVGTYPVDHPFRAQFLTELANQQSDSVGKALDKRISFLFFLGSPDAEGNVSAVDVRFMDPLRDVANYATLGGVISSLNPLISAPLAMWDPQIIYGSTSLYPNVSYDSFYGIEVAGTQGSPLNAIEQVVPQVTALDAALDLSGQYRNLATKNPTAFAKTIFEALNVPFAQVQHVNLKQLAAKGEIARYDVAKSAAENAFSTGDFSGLAGFASVPNPLNPDYEVTPAQLQEVYAAAQQAYPGLPPEETVTPPPTPAGL